MNLLCLFVAHLFVGLCLVLCLPVFMFLYIDMNFCWECYSMFYVARGVFRQIEQRLCLEVEQRDRELAEKVAWATLAQLQQKLDQDMKLLCDRHQPSKEKDARDAALDVRYLQARQQMFGGRFLKCHIFRQSLIYTSFCWHNIKL